MRNTLELSRLFVCLGGLIKRDRKKMLGCGLLGGVSTQADTMKRGISH